MSEQMRRWRNTDLHALDFKPTQHFFSIIAAEDKFGAVFQDDRVLPTHERLEFSNAVDPDDRRAMYAKEVFRVEAFFHAVDRSPQEVGFPLRVNPQVISKGRYPVDFFD